MDLLKWISKPGTGGEAALGAAVFGRRQKTQPTRGELLEGHLPPAPRPTLLAGPAIVCVVAVIVALFVVPFDYRFAIGVSLAGTIIVVTFVGAYVPFVGAWVAGGFAVLIALSTGSSSDALIMAIVALLANGILQQMIQPFVMGATLSLNPLVVLVVTIGAGALFGMVGLTLAAPLTSAAVHIVDELRERRKEEAPAGVAPMPSG